MEKLCVKIALCISLLVLRVTIFFKFIYFSKILGKLTGPEFANNIFDEIVSNNVTQLNDNKTVALQKKSTDSIQFVKNTTGKILGQLIGGAIGNSERDIFDNNAVFSEVNFY